MTPRRTALRVAVAALLPLAGAAACSGSDNGTGGKTVTLITHDSFAISDGVLKAFTRKSGIAVKILKSGDAGAAVNQAILTKKNPQGDVFFGVDNTFLSRALDEHLFTPYEAAGVTSVPTEFQLDPQHRATPIDYGDVCVNYDKKYFTGKKLAPPQSFDDLAKPEYRNLLVAENPATSSPGLAFVLGSVAQYGSAGWQPYWQRLKANGVEVVDSWDQAYNNRFSGGSASKGDKPLVVSYASSPAAEVAYAEKPTTQAPTGVATATCFRQVEFAGLLSGAKHPAEGRAFIDFLLGPDFQQDIPLQMFVYPVRPGVTPPAVFRTFAVKVDDSKTLPPSDIAANRDQWIKAWTSTMR
jgi:thiamine transport system substrate-binding protein